MVLRHGRSLFIGLETHTYIRTYKLPVRTYKLSACVQARRNVGILLLF